MKMLQKSLRAFFTVVFLMALAAPTVAHEGEDTELTETTGGRVLGSISFPTATRVPEAQQAFIGTTL